MHKRKPVMSEGKTLRRSSKISADMGRACLHPHLLLILLAFSYHIISSTAVPSTRAERMLKEVRDLPTLQHTNQVIAEEQIEEATHVRMDLELNDYPGSGANNRHIPRPAGRR